MTCEQFDSTGTYERYLAGTLSEPERDAFEEHYFACDRCFEALTILKATREGLRASGAPAPVTAHPPAPLAMPAPKPRRALWTGIGIAAALLAGAVALTNFHSAPPVPKTARVPASGAPSAAFELEARMDPPAWVPQVLRGAELASFQRFQQAMAPYAAHDYAAVSTGLRSVLEADPSSLDARYFLGICELLTGNLEPGIAELRSVIATGSASPYLEEAHFYLGKALLRQGKLSEARKQFEWVAGQAGDLRDNAAAILNRLPLP